MPAAGSPFISMSKPYVCAPSSTRATSPSRITEPSGLARRMMLANCSAVLKRLWREDRRVDLAPLGERPVAERAAARLAVLLLHRGERVGGGEVERRELAPGRARCASRTRRRTSARRPRRARGAARPPRARRRSSPARASASSALRRQRDDHQEAGVRLDHLHALTTHLFRETRLDAPQAVLHLHQRDVDVGARAERHARWTPCRSTGSTTTCTGSPRRR